MLIIVIEIKKHLKRTILPLLFNFFQPSQKRKKSVAEYATLKNGVTYCKKIPISENLLIVLFDTSANELSAG